jgi:prepilin peptidase CpaA
LNAALLAGSALVLLALTGAGLDYTVRRLPNLLCLITALAGLAASFTLHGASGAGSAALHGLIALVVGMVLFRFGAVGGGDAKFYAGIAMWFALGQAPRLLLAVSLSGLLLFIVWFTVRRLMGKKVHRRAENDADRFPYGAAIAAGAVVAWFTA